MASSSVVGNLKVNFSANTQQYTRDAKKIKEENQGIISQLKDFSGKGSTLGQLLKIGAGGGAAFAIGKIASDFDEITKKALEFSVALRKGGDEARKLGADLLTSIPIAGKLGEGLANIYSIISGEARYVAEITEATKAQEEHIQRVVKLREEFEKFEKTIRSKTPYTEADDRIEELKKKSRDEANADIIAAKKELASLTSGSPLGPSGRFGETKLDRKVFQGLGLPDVDEVQQRINALNEKIGKANQSLKENLARADKDAIEARGQIFGTLQEKEIKRLVEIAEKAKKYQQDGFEMTKKEALEKNRFEIRQQIENGEKKVKIEQAKHEKLIDVQKKFTEESKKLTELAEKTLTPQEALSKKLGDLNLRYLLGPSLGGIDLKTFNALREKYRSELPDDYGATVQLRRSSFAGTGKTFTDPNTAILMQTKEATINGWNWLKNNTVIGPLISAAEAMGA